MKKATIIWCDNMSSIAIAKNPMFHSRTKHIDIRFHYIRSLVADGIITLKHCSTSEQLTDLLTKPLPAQHHQELKFKMGVEEIQIQIKRGIC